MLFCVLCIDRPGSAALRAATRAEHLEYMIAARGALRYGGPLTSDDGTLSLGSVFVIDLPDRRAVDAFLAAEPYCVARLFQSVSVLAMRQMVPEAVPGFLDRELSRERAASAEHAKR